MNPTAQDRYKYQFKSFVKKEVQSFVVGAAKITKDPSRKRIHQLRVSVRKLQSTLGGNFLKKLNKRLGKIRDLDVLIRNAKSYHLKVNGPKKQRKKLRKEIKERLRSKKFQNLHQELEKKAEKSLDQPQLTSRAHEMIDELKTWNRPLKEEELHSFRKTIKRIHYLLEATGQNTDILKDLQDHLGRIHDLDVLARYYKKNVNTQNDKKTEVHTTQKLIKPALRWAFKELRELT